MPDRKFQDYADSAEIKKILVDSTIPITLANQLVTKKHFDDNASSTDAAAVAANAAAIALIKASSDANTADVAGLTTTTAANTTKADNNATQIAINVIDIAANAAAIIANAEHSVYDWSARTEADLGAAYTAWNAAAGSPEFNKGIVFVKWKDGKTYVLVSASSPASAASYTSTSALMAMATTAEVTAGINTANAIAPLTLREEMARALGISPATLSAGAAGINAGGGVAGVANRFVLLDAGGRIDLSFLNIAGLDFISSADMAAAIPTAPPGGFSNGQVYIATGAEAAPDASWGFLASILTVRPGDMALYDGANWHHVSTSTSLTAAVLKAGSNAMAIDGKLIWAAGAAADTIIVDGNDAANAIVQNVTLKTGVINGGTF